MLQLQFPSNLECVIETHLILHFAYEREKRVLYCIYSNVIEIENGSNGVESKLDFDFDSFRNYILNSIF